MPLDNRHALRDWISLSSLPNCQVLYISCNDLRLRIPKLYNTVLEKSPSPSMETKKGPTSGLLTVSYKITPGVRHLTSSTRAQGTSYSILEIIKALRKQWYSSFASLHHWKATAITERNPNSDLATGEPRNSAFRINLSQTWESYNNSNNKANQRRATGNSHSMRKRPFQSTLFTMSIWEVLRAQCKLKAWIDIRTASWLDKRKVMSHREVFEKIRDWEPGCSCWYSHLLSCRDLGSLAPNNTLLQRNCHPKEVSMKLNVQLTSRSTISTSCER